MTQKTYPLLNFATSACVALPTALACAADTTNQGKHLQSAGIFTLSWFVFTKFNMGRMISNIQEVYAGIRQGQLQKCATVHIFPLFAIYTVIAGSQLRKLLPSYLAIVGLGAMISGAIHTLPRIPLASKASNAEKKDAATPTHSWGHHTTKAALYSIMYLAFLGAPLSLLKGHVPNPLRLMLSAAIALWTTRVAGSFSVNGAMNFPQLAKKRLDKITRTRSLALLGKTGLAVYASYALCQYTVNYTHDFAPSLADFGLPHFLIRNIHLLAGAVSAMSCSPLHLAVFDTPRMI